MTAPLVVLMPVYDDWPLIRPLLVRLNAGLAAAGLSAEVILADDGSTSTPGPDLLQAARLEAITTVTVLHLGRNVGHQRALAIGLAYIHANRACRAVVIMDADGEDAPEDVPRLVAAHDGAEGAIVFAGRSARSEGLRFRMFYELYRLTHRLLTGRRIWFGNFSVVPARLLPRLALLSELWNHYPSAIIKARIPFTSIPLPRGSRLGGGSKMSLTGLILHGLGAISVHGDVIGVRALLATLVAIVFCLAGIVTVVVIRSVTDLAIPGWASAVVGLLVAILLQAVLLSLVFIFVTLNSRNYSAVIPRRDYADYLAGETRVYP
ncbi:MAG TPA: glycosyltransferase [Methylomirabilota bacterium]|jgi:hypothetical protein